KGGDPPGEPKSIKISDGTPDGVADLALRKLADIAQKFLVEGEPYRSLVHPMWKKHYGDYDHLARVKEWAASGGESEVDWCALPVNSPTPQGTARWQLPIRSARCLCPPMPARAKRTCWCNG